MDLFWLSSFDSRPKRIYKLKFEVSEKIDLSTIKKTMGWML